MNNNLPEGYELLKPKKAYWKPSQMQEGENKLRLVMRPISGWSDWDGKQPHRYRPNEKPLTSFDPEKEIKPFWNCYVWDYAREKLFVLEITQASIFKALETLAEDKEWGDLLSYDIKITKTGSGKETRYKVTPLPPKPIAPHILEALAKNPVRLEALYEGKDPWEEAAVSSPKEEWKSTFPQSMEDKHELMGTPLETLKELLEAELLDVSRVDEYLAHIAQKKKVSIDSIVNSALLKGFTERFKNSYVKWCHENEAISIA